VTQQAESGTLGADWSTGNDAGIGYITITSDGAGSNPGSAARVATYSVTFPEAGSYELYARVRVGAGSFSDDSFFYGNGFGAKNPAANGDWVLVNGLGAGGYTGPADVVDGGGGAGSQVWKWLNISLFAPGGSFTVSGGALTQTFQIGARENGLWIDKLLFGTAGYTFTVAELDSGGPGVAPEPPTPPEPGDFVRGNLIQFNDNGGWSWYMDERAIVDVAGGRLVAGSDATGAGVNGTARSGGVDAVVFNFESGTSERSELFIGAPLGPDDHNAPAFMLRPDGKYLAQWTGHNNNFLSYFSIYDGASWDAYTTFDWEPLGATSSEQASYSNPHYLSAENRAYTFVRSLDIKSMNILVSTNQGDTWSYYGKLNRSYPGSGYNPGYYRFCDNGVDRIDFICTESHPRDTLTSMYHGYISNGMSFRSDGTVVDANLNDTTSPLSSDFTLIFANGTVLPPGQTNYRCWNSDVQSYPDGTVQAIIHARINQSAHIGGYPDQEDPNHAFFFCRYDGANWTSTYLCQAGYKLYPAEADYVGLGACHPNDPNTIFISTRYDPRAVQPGVFDTNQPYSDKRELWKGATTDHGASFTWTPITEKSLRDNFRPIVPAWDANNTALLWFRGTYTSAQIYDAAVVGLLDRPTQAASLMTYVDATTGNTTLSNGAPLVTGGGANQWHERAGTYNGGSVLASADAIAEDAPTIRTTVTAPESATYDVWVNYWGDPSADWRIKAGMSAGNMQILRQLGGQAVEPGFHTASIVLTNSSTNVLYQAYVGRVTGDTIAVFVDDEPIVTGTTGPTAGDTVRTMYDGISYAKVSAFGIIDVAYNAGGTSATVTWQSAPPEASLSTTTYSLWKKSALTDLNWTLVASGIPSSGASTSHVDSSAGDASAFYRVSVP